MSLYKKINKVIERHTEGGGQPCEDGGTDCSYATINQGMPKISGKLQQIVRDKGNSSRGLGENGPANLLISHF